MTDKWEEDPFKLLDELGLKNRELPVVREAYERKIAEAPVREALMNEILPRTATANDFNKPGPEVSRILSQLADTPEDRERKLQCTIGNIHTVARHILGLGIREGADLFVGVQPMSGAWRVVVRYSVFAHEARAPEISEALETMLSTLASILMKKLDEGMKVLESIK